jgi:excisionase family DNA binding protein
MVTVEEARRRLGVARSTLYRLMSEGRLPYVRPGRERRIRVQALSAFLDQQRVTSAEFLTHGARYAYEVGCRCDACRAAWNNYHRRARRQRAANLDVSHRALEHGKIGTYRNHGCRCEACCQAQSEANRRRPSRAQQAS